MLMNQPSSKFLLAKTVLSIPELQWAFENGVIGAQTVVDVASALLADGIDAEPVPTLAGLSQADLTEVKDVLTGHLNDADVETIRAKWLWLLLSSIYEQEQDENRRFETIDELYADFGYPEEMIPFGPYAPAYEGKRDPSETRQEVLREWRRYLERGELRFGRHRER